MMQRVRQSSAIISMTGSSVHRYSSPALLSSAPGTRVGAAGVGDGDTVVARIEVIVGREVIIRRVGVCWRFKDVGVVTTCVELGQPVIAEI